MASFRNKEKYYIFQYQTARPGGYTDDLGIMADENTYVDPQYAGWVFSCYGSTHDSDNEFIEWCNDSKIKYWNPGWRAGEPRSFARKYFVSPSDADAIILRWF